MTELRLYKGVTFDGVSVFPYFGSKSAFDTYMAGKQTYSQAINFNRIGEPILLNLSYDDAIGYSYASLNTGERTYFLTITEVTVNENNRVFLGYTVDWYTTLFYESEISFRRCHLVKSTSADPKKYPQAISPNDMRITSRTTLLGDPQQPALVLNGLLISYVTDDTKSALSCIYSPLMGYSAVTEPNGTRGSISLHDVFSGGLTSITGIAPKDVVGIWYLPYTARFSAMRKEGTDYHYWYEFDLYGPSQTNTINASISTDAMNMGVITDPSGSILYTVPYGRTLSKIYYRIIASWTQVFAEIFFIYGNGIQAPNYYNSVENSSILVPCPQVDFNNDTYANWTAGMRGIEIEERRIQKNKALVQNISGSVMTGAIGGTAGGPAGAAVGVAGQIAASLVSYGVDTYYDNVINVLEDKKYQHMQDTMVPGSFLMTGNHNYQVIQLSACDDMGRYTAELSNFGADCNLPLSSWTPSVGAFKFADVEIVADVPYNVKQAIKNKMISGIKIVGV